MTAEQLLDEVVKLGGLQSSRLIQEYATLKQRAIAITDFDKLEWCFLDTLSTAAERACYVRRIVEPKGPSQIMVESREGGPDIDEMVRQNELMRMNLCPHALRYGRTCDDGPTEWEIYEFLS